MSGKCHKFMMGQEAVIRVFQEEGVNTIFTLMAEDNLSLFATIEEEWGEEFSVIHTRHQQWAVAMADGYSRANGDIGVAFLSRGPGVAQTGNALVTAREFGSKILVIAPESSLTSSNDAKGFEQESYLETMVGEVISIRSVERIVPALEDVFRRLRAGEGPIGVQIPWNLFEEETDKEHHIENYTPRSQINQGTVHPSSENVKEAIELYLDSDATKPPVIVAGRGAVMADAREALETVAERTSALLATTLPAQGFFSEHPYSLGFIGNIGSELANKYSAKADCIFAFGCSLNIHTTGHGDLLRDDANVVHIDKSSSSLNRYTEVDLAITGDAKTTAELIAAELEKRDIDRGGEFWTEDLDREIAEHTDLDDQPYPEQEGRADPREVVPALNEMLPQDRFVVSDGGHFMHWILDAIDIPNPNNFIFPLDFSAIGIALPAGVGAAMRTEKPCVTFCGDAGFLMSLTSVETAARNDIPVLIIVLNDSALGSEYHNLDTHDGYADVAKQKTPYFEDVAESLGAEGYTVRSPSDLEVIQEQLGQKQSGPVVVDCRLNLNVRHRTRPMTRPAHDLG